MATCGACGFENAQAGKACPLCGDTGGEATLASDQTPTVALPPGVILAAAERAGETSLGPGDVFEARYRVETLLGRGGMGTVYRVLDLTEPRTLALKILRPVRADEPETLERFRREVGFLGKLRHPAVPRVVGWGLAGAEPYFLTEFVEGSDLKSAIRSRGPWPVDEAAALAATVADALEAAHALGVIHRDVKPHNILLVNDGSVRLLDFGIARPIGLEMKTITKTDVVVGTPEYMSPEQLVSHRVDERSDIYSLGIVLFELLTGRLPFVGDTPLGIALKHQSEPPPPPRSLRPELPAWVERIVLKCLEKDRARRFLTAAELAAELRRPHTAGKKRRKRLPSGDEVVEDEGESSDWALVLEAPKEKVGWQPGMALRFEDRYYRLEELVPVEGTAPRRVYRFSIWPAHEVFRGVVDYEADCVERQAAGKSSLSGRLKGWWGERR